MNAADTHADTQTPSIQTKVSAIRSQHATFFASQKTKDIAFRKQSLRSLKREVEKREADIFEALKADFNKSVFETVLSETGLVLSELSYIINNLRHWSRSKRVSPTMLNFPSSAALYPEPYGCTLIIAPWNYPFQLAMLPLIGAVAAGNTAMVKPSELTPNTSRIIVEIIEAVFDSNHVTAIEGGIPTSQALLEQRWDYIFFTGSVQVGKIVAKAAAEHLTPTTLELGGKNPCIIDDTAAIKLAAKRIVWGKFLNGGQTCVAPDYILIHKNVKDRFVDAMKNEVQKAYGNDPKSSPDFPRIVNEKNFNRLTAMLEKASILIGGEHDKETLYIAPTLIDEPALDSEVMKDEIFGPILPILSFEDRSQIEKVITTYDKPLSFYVFSKRRLFAEQMIRRYSFGGGAVNDTIVQFANHRLPFGGVGNSGIGAYHGKATFDTFTHQKPVVKRGNWIDVPVRYAPYKGKLNILKLFLKYF